MELKVVNESDERLDLKITGRLDASAVDIIGPRFLGLLNHVEKNVFVDFSEITYVSSIGIRLLLNGWKMAKRDGFGFQLTNTLPEVRQIFMIAGLLEVLE